MYKIEDVSAIRNWEWQDWYRKSSVTYDNLPAKYASLMGTTVTPQADYIAMTGSKIYSGKWNEYQDKINNSKTVKYTDGNLYRTETVFVQQGSGSESNGVNATNLDSINLDFHPDINSAKLTNNQFSDDWDIGFPTPEGVPLSDLKNSGRTGNGGYDLRIHSTFNFCKPYEYTAERKRANKDKVLYVRIESEPIVPLPFVKAQNTEHMVYSTVRQIILNINQSNYDVTEGGEVTEYRPLMFFYSGPEQIRPQNVDENGCHRIRPSKPVILNFYADARVILFAPNSPVVINGNGHQMHGFVIAKEYMRLATAEDFRKIGDRFYGEDGTEYFKIKNEAKDATNKIFGTCDLFIDSKGNVQTKPLPLKSGYTRNPIYDNNLEKPTRTDVIKYRNYERVYKMHTAFNLDTDNERRGTTYYDSFGLDSLKRNVYTYLDNYKYGDEEHPNSVDMFFTTLRSTWID